MRAGWLLPRPLYDAGVERDLAVASPELEPAAATERRPSLRRRLAVLQALTSSDLRARYGRGRWQFVKWLVDPFALVGVYLVFVSLVLDLPTDAPGLSLACAVIPFQLVTMATVAGSSAIYLRSSVLLNMRFDRLLIPVAATATEIAALGASLLMLPVLMAAYGVAPTTAVLWLGPVIALNVFVAVACAYAASLFGLWYIHLRPLFISFVRTLFFLAPSLVPLAAIGGRANDLIRLNPLTGLFEAYRSALLFGEAPEWWHFAVPLAFAAVVLAVVVPVYAREQDHFAKVLW